jgi:hypothetical protein
MSRDRLAAMRAQQASQRAGGARRQQQEEEQQYEQQYEQPSHYQDRGYGGPAPSQAYNSG